MSALTQSQKRPPLAPSKLRMPLRKITNILPQPTPVHPLGKTRFSASFFPVSKNEKENASNPIPSSSKPRKPLQARRGSIVVRPTQATNQAAQVQPRRRASVAVLPTHGMMNSSSLVSDSKRAWRMSRVFSPQRATSLVMSTPAAAPRSSKFMGSPPPVQGTGSWKPKNPTVIALQKKQLVWSPLRMRGFRNSSRRSFTPMLPN